MTSTYAVAGMTCEHCVRSVTEEVSEVPGVTAVEVDLAGGRVTVRGDADDDAVRVMSRIAADLERVVRRHPTQWFNFYRFWEDAAGERDPLRSPSAQPEEASARV